VNVPPLGLMTGVATVCPLTFKLNVVVFVIPPPDAATVIVELPAAVELLALMVSVEEQLGLQLGEDNEAVAPEGSPDTEKETAWALPETKVAEIELVTEDPAITALSPELARVKLKGWVNVKEALASALALDPLLNALAFIVALFVRVTVPAYIVDDCVGAEPSVV
jgi:hypothetical protein